MKVLVTARLPEKALELIKEKHEVHSNPNDSPIDRKDIISSIGDKDGLLSTIADKIDMEVISAAKNLKVIANYGVGFNNIDVEAAGDRGIMVTNTPGVLTESTADLAFTLLLAVSRRVVEGDRIMRNNEYKFWAPLHFLGSDVYGKSLGIIGLGRIGRAVAARAKGFSMRVLYHKTKRLDEEEEKSLGIEYRNMDALLAESDFVSLHVPLTDDTRHLIGAGQIAMMKKRAFLINTSRGPVVDEAALVKALQNNTIQGAGLDVYENEPLPAEGLADLDNVVLLPHVGSATTETRTKMATMAVDNLMAGLREETPPNLVMVCK